MLMAGVKHKSYDRFQPFQILYGMELLKLQFSEVLDSSAT